MVDTVKISVLLEKGAANHFDSYCREKGFKKSSLIARLVREHLEHEGYAMQQDLFQSRDKEHEKNEE